MGRKPTDFTGQRFGTLTAVRLAKTTRGVNHQTWWWFRCDCGEEVMRIPFGLSPERSLCDKCRKGNQHQCWKGEGEISGSVFSNIRYDAKDRGLDFDISLPYIWELFLSQDRRCALTGWDLAFSPVPSKKYMRTASLDRIDSSRGYTKDNVQWVHREVNRLKKQLTDERFIELCLAVDAHCNGNKRKA